MKRYLPLVVIFLIIFFDQWSKLYIKTHWMLGDEFRVADWFIIHFTENNGMAYGMEFGGEWGKLALSLFRVVAIGGIGYYLFTLIKQNEKPLGYAVTVALVFAGALGNLIDSAFYGMWFNDSYFQIAQFAPAEGGYSNFLHGKVVDMLYFPILEGHFPEWMPIWGGEHYIFFRPVFNIADSAITTGIFSVLLFYRRMLTSD